MVGTVVSASALNGNALVLGEEGNEFIVKPMPDGRLQISASSGFGTIHNRLDAGAVLALRNFLNACLEQST